MSYVSEPEQTLHPWALEWLMERRISEETAHELGLCSLERTNKDGGEERVVRAPYIHSSGKIVNIKDRLLPKSFRQSPQASKYLYNLPSLDGFDVVVIVEGEMDVAACWEAGWKNAVSPQDGAPAEKRDPNTKDLLGVADVGSKGDGFREPEARAHFARMRRIIIATDNDPGGNKLAEWLVDEFGPERCLRVQFPDDCKDANDVLRKHGVKELDRLLSTAKPYDLPGIIRINDIREQIYEMHENGYAPGLSTGFAHADRILTPIPGSTIITTGRPSHGKSSLLLNIHANMAHQHGHKFAMFSPELGTPRVMAMKIAKIVANRPFLPNEPHRMEREVLDPVLDWINDHFVRIDATIRGDTFATITLEDIVKRFEMVMNREGYNHLVIDPWNRLQAYRPQGQNVTEYVAHSLNVLSRLAERNGIFVWIVAHPTKGDLANIKNEDEMPTPYSIADSSHWYNMADFILGVQRNKYSEPINRTKLSVMKMREEGFGGYLGDAYFRFDARTGRFHEWVDNDAPKLLGSDPFVDLPEHLMPNLVPVQGNVTLLDHAADWENEQAW